MKKTFSFLAIGLLISNVLNANILFDSVQYKNCEEYANIIEENMSGECGGDSEIFNMAYSYCKENKFQGVPEVSD